MCLFVTVNNYYVGFTDISASVFHKNPPGVLFIDITFIFLPLK